jgi:predicted transposase/invertase (TIGR01784 family)
MLGASYDDGEQKGMVMGIRIVAKNMKTMGMPVDQISAATGLSEEEIERL